MKENLRVVHKVYDLYIRNEVKDMYKNTIIVEVESDNLESVKSISGILFKTLGNCKVKDINHCYFEENIEKDRMYFDRDECEIEIREMYKVAVVCYRGELKEQLKSFKEILESALIDIKRIDSRTISVDNGLFMIYLLGSEVDKEESEKVGVADIVIDRFDSPVHKELLLSTGEHKDIDTLPKLAGFICKTVAERK